MYAVKLDDDNDIDIIIAASDPSHLVAWYENNGSGSFTRHDVATLNDVWAVVAADMELDVRS